jgi:hypothetical protein
MVLAFASMHRPPWRGRRSKLRVGLGRIERILGLLFKATAVQLTSQRAAARSRQAVRGASCCPRAACGRREFQLVKSLTVAAAFLCVTTTSAAAEAWTCSYVAGLTRFEVSPPDLIDAEFHKHYPILENNDYGFVAASSISQIEKGDKTPTVGVTTVVITKGPASSGSA